MIDGIGLHCDTYCCVAEFPYIDDDGDEWLELFRRARQVGWITVSSEDGDERDYCPLCARKREPKPSPEYYTLSMPCTEVRHVIEALGLSYHVGTALAYLCRAGRKPGAEYVNDIGKAIAHLRFEVELWTRAQPDATVPTEGAAIRG